MLKIRNALDELAALFLDIETCFPQDVILLWIDEKISRTKTAIENKSPRAPFLLEELDDLRST